MQIRKIMNNVLAYLVGSSKNRPKYNLDAKYWIQSILLKNQLKSTNKTN